MGARTPSLEDAQRAFHYDPVAGTLVGLSGHEVVVARRDELAGVVHVHFPRIGFQIKPQQPA